MNLKTERRIVTAAAALVAPDAAPLINNLDAIGEMADSAAAYLESEDSAPMWIEVSAVCGFDAADGIETCNDAPDKAEGVAVYIRNPLALHIRDFTPETVDPFERVSMREAHFAAFRWAGALASHLGCEVETHAPPASIWPSRFVMEPQRDFFADDVGGNDMGTNFGLCEPEQATQWAVFKLAASHTGAPIAGTGELVEDYPTREAAQAAIDALERGEPLPDPNWPEEDEAEALLTALRFTRGSDGIAQEWMSRTLSNPDTGATCIIWATTRDGQSVANVGDWRFSMFRNAAAVEACAPFATLEGGERGLMESGAYAALLVARGAIGAR